MDALPNEILQEILYYVLRSDHPEFLMSYDMYLALMYVCSRWYALVTDYKLYIGNISIDRFANLTAQSMNPFCTAAASGRKLKFIKWLAVIGVKRNKTAYAYAFVYGHVKLARKLNDKLGLNDFDRLTKLVSKHNSFALTEQLFHERGCTDFLLYALLKHSLKYKSENTLAAIKRKIITKNNIVTLTLKSNLYTDRRVNHWLKQVKLTSYV